VLLLRGGKMATRKLAKVSRTTKKQTTAKRFSPRKQKDFKIGSRYKCDVCGLSVMVDEVCGCVDFCDIICCGEQMKPAK
jgi:hypothetical protein